MARLVNAPKEPSQISRERHTSSGASIANVRHWLHLLIMQLMRALPAICSRGCDNSDIKRARHTPGNAFV